MTDNNNSKVWHNVASPFCGIGVDDLTIEVTGNNIQIVENGDEVTRVGFETPLVQQSPQVNGKDVSLAQAVEHAANLLQQSKQTVIGGMATDLNGARAAMSLADTTKATVDNMDSAASVRNTAVLQDTGYMITTLSEVRNRADLILVIGCDIEASYPRFFENIVWNEQSLFEQDTASRQVVYLGTKPSGQASVSPTGKAATELACDNHDLPEVLSILRALVNNKQVQAEQVAGIKVADLAVLAEQLKQAKYSVITWSSAELAFDNAEATVQMTCEMIKDINNETRCNGLALGGKDGSITANQVSGWQSSYPMRVDFNQGFAHYDPYLGDSERMLANDEVETLVWVSSFNIESTPPKSNAKTIVLGRSGMEFEQQPEVYIPVGTPGVDHAGRTFRCDGVVSLPLQKLRDSGLPSSHDVLTAIKQAVGGK